MIKGCERKAHAKRLCGSHYQGQRKAELAASGCTCSFDGCGKSVHNLKRELCELHYARYLKYGDPALTGRPDLGKTLERRFWEKVDKSGPIPARRPDLGACWVWTLPATSHGYGQFIVMRGKRGYPRRAHRVAWELVRGPVPRDLDLDHLCRNRICVNPDHLEPVTNEENIKRGTWQPILNSAKTHCDRNHEFTPENTYHPPKRPHVRQCRECARIRRRNRGAEVAA